MASGTWIGKAGWAVLVAACMAIAARGADAPPSITPPDQVAFNYPDPPREGERDFFVVADGGQAKCVIVLPVRADARERESAETLQVYLELATGARFQQIPDEQPLPAGMGAIHVGAMAVAAKVDLGLPEVRYGDAALPNVNGYLVKTLEPQTLLIRGHDSRATMMGVVGFLKRYAGVRRYWPGEPGGLGDVVPLWPTLRLPRLEWRDWPYFISRNMSGGAYGPPPESKRGARVRFVDFLRMNHTIPSNESYYKLLPLQEYGRSHPEYFPLISGKRFVPLPPEGGPKPRRPPQGWQPCVSNPEVVKILAEAIVKIFRENPDQFATNLAVNDGLGDCTCEKCRAMDAPGADPINRIGLCDRYIKFNNRVCEQVAKEFPGKIIVFLTYGSMTEPPTTVRLHPMLMAQVSPHAANAFALWDRWVNTGARHLGFQFYQGDVRFIIPKVSAHQWANRIRYAVASNRARSFYISYHGIWPLTGMVGHVVAELSWDPRRDVEALAGEDSARFYGPAAEPMKRFYDAMEAGYRRWLEEDEHPHPFGKDQGSLSGSTSFAQFKVLTPAEAATARAALAAAVAAAGADEKLRKRVDVVERLFGFAQIGARQMGRCAAWSRPSRARRPTWIESWPTRAKP